MVNLIKSFTHSGSGKKSKSKLDEVSGGYRSPFQTPLRNYTDTMGIPKASATPRSTNTNQQQLSKKPLSNNPHKFFTGLNSRANKCAVCLGTIQFVKQAAKCEGGCLKKFIIKTELSWCLTKARLR